MGNAGREMAEQGGSRRVGIVVLNWHGREKTVACLRAVANLSYPDFFVVLLDNGCREFATEDLAPLGLEVLYRSTTENLGFAGGANAGMRVALDHGAEYVWFLNNDALPEPEALAELVATLEAAPGAGLAGAKILLASEPRRLDSVALHVNTCSGRFCLTGHGEIDHGQYEKLTDVVAVTGCAMFVRKDVCENLGGFDERFFAYLEDADLCLRARASGVRVLVAPRARVRHDRATATAGRQSPASIYYTTRNHLMLMARHGSGGKLISLARQALIPGLHLAYALRAGTSDLRPRVQAVLQAVRDYRKGVVGASWRGRAH